MAGALAISALMGCGPAPPAAETPRCCRVVVEPVASGEIRGRISRRGAGAAPELVVHLRGASGVPPLAARADARGRFFFGPVPPGDYELVVATRDGLRAVRRRVTIRDGDSLELTIEVPPRP